MHSVQRSPRGGNGLFASVALPIDTEVASLAGPSVSVREFDARVDAGTLCQYAGMRVGRRYVVDAGLWRGEAPGAWFMMTHSLVDNVRPRLLNGRVAFVTTRAVEAGSELLYAYDTWAPPGWIA